MSESKTDTAASTTAETTTAELTESVTTTTTAAETSKLTTTTGTTIVSTYDPATATEATTTTTTTTTAPPEEPSEMTPAEIIEKKKADGEFKEYESLYEMPEFKTDVPEEMSPDLYMYAEEKELTGHAVGYSNSRFGLGVTLYNGPSAAFSKASPYPVPYGHAVDVYARFQVSGDRLPREHGFVYDWLYCCYNGVWGWCESFELADSPIELPNVTMPDKYFEPYRTSRPTSDNSGYYFIKTDSLEVMPSPDDSGEPLEVLKNREQIRLLGTTIPDSEWTFISYYAHTDDNRSREGLGWVYIGDMGEDLYTVSEYYDEFPVEKIPTVAAKPAVYLYPEQTTDVSVKLTLHDMELKTTYPKYNGGWNVTASPDGSLLNKADGHSYDYLFWDAYVSGQPFDLSRGFCVKGSGTEEFLREKLTLLGLNEREMNEFIVYWLPLMDRNNYNFITFQTDCYTDRAELMIEPKPDTMLRVFMTVTPLNKPIKTTPQKLKKTVRKGFTAVEWGGTIIRQ